jgi:hypothetical protein
VSASAAQPLELSGRDAAAGSLALLAAGLARPLLGHPPALSCPLRALTGIPCPLCGMTSGVEDTLHGHPLQAAGANPLAPVLVAAALYALVCRPSALRLPRWAAVLAVGAAWLFELGRFGVLGSGSS